MERTRALVYPLSLSRSTFVQRHGVDRGRLPI